MRIWDAMAKAPDPTPAGLIEAVLDSPYREYLESEFVDSRERLADIKQLVVFAERYDNTEQFFYLCRYVSGEPKLDEGNELRDMQKGGANYYEPVWYEIGKISQLLFYPLEIKDWFLKDVKSDFKNTPREAKIKISDLRQLV